MFCNILYLSCSRSVLCPISQELDIKYDVINIMNEWVYRNGDKLLEDPNMPDLRFENWME